MARRRKRLVDLVRDGTFLARKDERLLAASEPLSWPGLEAFRAGWRAADPDERREVALELERRLRDPDGARGLLGDLQTELRRLGPPGSFRRLERFFPRFFTHRAGPAAGRPFRLEGFQRDFLREWSRRHPNGERVYQVGVWGVPKGNGKTPVIAGLGVEALVSHTDRPEVYAVAGSRDQANICHAFASLNVEDGALAAWLDVAGDSIVCAEHDGEFTVLSAAGELGHGISPTLFLVDEWWLYVHRGQREAYNAGARALHKRPGVGALLAITTAGWDRGSQLGETFDQALAHPALEVNDTLEPGPLYRVCDPRSGFLFEWWAAPDGADIEDPRTIRKANPLSVVRPQDLLRELHRPDTDELDWRRLHLNQWTKTRRAWKVSGIWRRLTSDLQIPDGGEITVGIDCGRSWDTTSVGWAYADPSGQLVTRAHVWSVRRDAPHHTFVPGGELVGEELVEPFVHLLASRYTVRGIAFDPRYFSTEARHLAGDGFDLVEVQPQSAAMGDALADFERCALAGRLGHDGDPVVTAHLENVEAETDGRGSTRIGKRGNAYPIDAAIANILAVYLALRVEPRPPSKPWAATW